MIKAAAAVPRLLVACDFDGTLAPIVNDPAAATAAPESIDALRRLGAMPSTWVAIVSGRRRDELWDRFGEEDMTLVGEHGSDWGQSAPPDPPVMTRARQRVEEAVAATIGSASENKHRSISFHYRLAPEPGPALDGLRQWATNEPGLNLLEGKMVLEFSVAASHKGDAVAALRRDLDADAVVFLGDDATDESVFVMLQPPDLGVKVGPGPTAAAARVAGPAEVSALLEDLADMRERN